MPFGKETSPHLGVKFQPGVSGNPAGKPKGAKHLSTHIQEMMADDSFTGDYIEGYKLKKHKGAPVKAIVRVAALKALAGDTKWAEWLAKYGYGTKLELANNPDNPITHPIDMDMVTQFMMMAKDQTKQ